MSKERELLKTILAYMAAEYLVMTEFEMITQIEDTIKEIQELLAQPEQTEQEPVTDKPTETAMAVMPNGICVSNVYDAYEEGRKSVMVEQEPVAWMWTRNYEGGGYTNKVFEFLNDAEEYAKDSKTLKSPDIICPLYTAPPKREPLSDEEIKMKWNRLPTNTKDPIIRFARAIEKAHGIGGGCDE